jgi:hypothetical protein
VAGCRDSSVGARTDLYDVLVNIPAREITVATHAKGNNLAVEPLILTFNTVQIQKHFKLKLLTHLHFYFLHLLFHAFIKFCSQNHIRALIMYAVSTGQFLGKGIRVKK